MGEWLGCGLEMIDVFHPPTVKYFLNWSGELRFLQNMKIARITKKNVLKMIENEENGISTMEDTEVPSEKVNSEVPSEKVISEEPSEKVNTEEPSEKVETDPTPPTEESTSEMETS